MPEEAHLLTRAVAGDAEALGELLRTYAPRLREALSIDARWRSVLEPDDVLQVTFLEAFLRIRAFKPAGPGAFLGWLRRIADNNLRDAVKGLGRQKRPPPGLAVQAPGGPGDSAMQLLEHLGVTTTTPSRVAAGNEVRDALNKALAALPADYAAVVRAYDLEGRDIAETAAMLGRSPGAVHMLRARGHAALAELLGAPAQFFSEDA